MSASTTEAPTVEGVKVGDFFASSWGYDQTNVDFYKVVGLTAKRIKVQHWQGKVVRDNGPQVYKIPGDGPKRHRAWTADGTPTEVEARVELKKVNAYRWNGERQVAFTVNSFANAYLWDGTPQYETGAGWGR